LTWSDPDYLATIRKEPIAKPLCYLPLIGETRPYTRPMQVARPPYQRGNEGVVRKMSPAKMYVTHDVVNE